MLKNQAARMTAGLSMQRSEREDTIPYNLIFEINVGGLFLIKKYLVITDGSQFVGTKESATVPLSVRPLSSHSQH